MKLTQALGLWWRSHEASGEFANGGSTIAPASWLVDLMGGGKTPAGVVMNESTGEGLPAIYAAVHVISEAVGQLPLKLFRKKGPGKGKEPDTEHPLYRILHDQTNPELTAHQYREMTTRHLAIWGRAYSFIQRDQRGTIKGLWPLHPGRMFVERDGLGRKLFRYYQGKGDYQTWTHNPDRPEIFHLHINCDDGLDGRSPLRINADSLGITKAADDYVGAWFGNGAIPGVILGHPGKLTTNAKEEIRRAWLERFMGAKKSSKLAILEKGIEVHVVGVDPEKSQLGQLRVAQIEAAARIYRVPLFLIQSQTKDTSWGSGIEQQMLGFINLTLMPWLTQWQQAISRDLLTRESINTHEALFVVNALVKGDLKSRVEAYSSARQNGWLNGNEIRELEDLNPVDPGESFWMPANMSPILGNGLPVIVEPEPPVEPEDDDDEEKPEVVN